MKILKYKPDIFIASYPNVYEMTASLMRAQEFTEGDYGLKNKFFSTYKLLDKYYQRYGIMNYYEITQGIYLHSSEIKYFFSVYNAAELNEKEISLRTAIGEKLKDEVWFSPISDIPEFHLLAVAEKYPQEDGDVVVTADDIVPQLLDIVDQRKESHDN